MNEIIRDMGLEDAGPVQTIEAQVHTHPWSLGNFLDTLRAGGQGIVLQKNGATLGYAVFTAVLDEGELLTLGVAPSFQRQGLGARLLGCVLQRARELKLHRFFLEVRASNASAQALYAKFNFQPVGRRRNYYATLTGQREDALLWECAL